MLDTLDYTICIGRNAWHKFIILSSNPCQAFAAFPSLTLILNLTLNLNLTLMQSLIIIIIITILIIITISTVRRRDQSNLYSCINWLMPVFLWRKNTSHSTPKIRWPKHHQPRNQCKWRVPCLTKDKRTTETDDCRAKRIIHQTTTTVY